MILLLNAKVLRWWLWKEEWKGYMPILLWLALSGSTQIPGVLNWVPRGSLPSGAALGSQWSSWSRSKELKGIWEHSIKAVMSFSKKSREQGVLPGQEQQERRLGPGCGGGTRSYCSRLWGTQFALDLGTSGCCAHGRPGLGCLGLEVCCTRARLLACLTPRFLKNINITRGFVL